MGELNVRGSVLYGPGTWGLSAPVAGAKVTLRQTSVGSSEARPIWEGTTDNAGEFSGKTAEWRRTVKIRVGPFEKDGPDPADVLALTVRVELSGQSAVMPFVYIADFVPSPPVVVFWTPPNAVVARIGGRNCYTVADVARQCVELMRAPTAVEIEVPEQSILGDASNQRQQIESLIDWWMTALARVLKADQTKTSSTVSSALMALRTGERQLQTNLQRVQLRVVTEAGSRARQFQSQPPKHPESQALLMTLSVICVVLQIVIVVVTLGTASPLIITALIALVATVVATGDVGAPAVVQAVVQIASRAGGLAVNVALTTTVTIVCIVLLVVLVFVLAGGQGFEWVRTTVLNGRSGWKFRLS